MRAIILLSGGLDSATVLAIARREGRECHAISFIYGQRHGVELAAATRVAEGQGVVEHLVFPLDLRLFGGSALTSDIAVPKDAVGALGIPVTYVPARNTIFWPSRSRLPGGVPARHRNGDAQRCRARRAEDRRAAHRHDQG